MKAKIILPESSTTTIRKPTMSESALPTEGSEDEYRLQCGRIIQTVREVSPACVVIFDKTWAPEKIAAHRLTETSPQP